MNGRYKACVSYDGTRFEGFQRQPKGHRTVQEELENALQAIFNKQIRIVGAGRTDSGVHASGQVISFDIKWKHSDQDLQNALNANLPEDIAVLKIEQIHDNFHPRFDATKRAYEYFIYNAPVRHPLHRNRSWWVKPKLDVEKMNEAATLLIGEHDFATFGQPPQGTRTLRAVFEAHWKIKAPFLIFSVQANAFLYRMVRSLVGSLKMVGEGQWSVAQFAEALEKADRSMCGPVAPPQGVYLVSVEYDAPGIVSNKL
ncbi:MAG: tRNA pseudouridine(38-40) synthase TruA [Chloroflexota bacterium]